jgi:hypothetical protein
VVAEDVLLLAGTVWGTGTLLTANVIAIDSPARPG